MGKSAHDYMNGMIYNNSSRVRVKRYNIESVELSQCTNISTLSKYMETSCKKNDSESVCKIMNAIKHKEWGRYVIFEGFIYSCVLERVGLLPLFLENPLVDVNKTDNSNAYWRRSCVPLVYLSIQGCVDGVKLLLQHDEIDINILDDCGMNIFDYVYPYTKISRRHREIFDILLDDGRMEIRRRGPYMSNYSSERVRLNYKKYSWRMELMSDYENMSVVCKWYNF